jgi:cytochrome c oxidase subunit 3
MLMAMLLASLGMGFGTLLVFYVVMGVRAAQWPPPGTPHLPQTLWISTAILLVSSGTMHWALRSVRRAHQRRLCAALLITALLGVAFLISQSLNWFVLVARNMPASLNMFAACFYLLTGAHGLHILGGLVPLGLTTTRAFRRRYTAAGHAGVSFCAIFWHFLDAVWLVMFAALMVVQ